jgi:signal transduction histidine kinase
MTLRSKTLFVIGCTLISLIVLLYISSYAILMGGYADLEAQNTQRNVERALNAFQIQIDNFNTVALGYANWDDSYQFVTDHNQLYIDRNFIDLTFADNELNVVLFLDNDLQIIYEKGFDLQTGQEVPIPESFRQLVLSDTSLVTHTDVRSIISGVVMLPEGYLMVTSQPIVTSEGTGPINGVMIWGRFLDETQIQNLADSTALALSIYRYEVNLLPEDVQTAKTALNNGEEIVVQALDDTTVTGYTIINDIYGNPALLMRIDLPREIYAQGQTSISYFFIALLVISLVFTVVTLISLEKIILARLGKLSATITHVRNSGDLHTPVLVNGDDELANLADGMRGMLTALAQSQTTLQQANDELEKRVEQRTTELSQANTLLREEVAERKQAQEKLAQARDQALEALRFKTQVFANVSHDARTPLSTIMLRTELLQLQRYGPITEGQHKILDLIMLSARQLLTFVENLLTEAQLSNKKIEIIRSEFSPVELLEEVSNSMMPLVEKKGLQLITEIRDNAPALVTSDSQRIRQILMNLVDNAIKFTPQGTITLVLYRPNNTHWALEVADTGMGIPPGVQQRIFEPFWQMDGSVTREANRGVGLGLSIVKQLTSLLEGELSLKSESGQGSTFTIILPLMRQGTDKDETSPSPDR